MYEQTGGAISTTLAGVSSQVFTTATIASILSLVADSADATVRAEAVTATNGPLTLTEGTELAYVATSDTAQTTLTVNSDVKVVLFQGAGGVDATFDTPAAAGGKEEGAAVAAAEDAGVIERVVVGTAGADKITIADDKNTQVTAGDGDTVIAGEGHDTVIAAQGDSTVVGGEHTIVKAVGSDADYVVEVDDGHALISNAKTGVSVDISNVQFVQLDNNEALIFADNVQQAAVANLYQALFGRTADELGLNYWFKTTDEGTDLGNVATVFMASEEYSGQDQTNAEFVASLYTNVLDREADAPGAEYWTGLLENGASRANVAATFVAAGTLLEEVDVVGSVTVVEGIIS